MILSSSKCQHVLFIMHELFISSIVFRLLNMAFMIIVGEDPDKSTHKAASNLDMHCLLLPSFWTLNIYD